MSQEFDEEIAKLRQEVRDHTVDGIFSCPSEVMDRVVDMLVGLGNKIERLEHANILKSNGNR